MKMLLPRLLFLLLPACGAAAYERYLVISAPGNAPHPGPGAGAGNGSVAKTFRLGKWEVTNREWAAFLNTVATGPGSSADEHQLFDSQMAADPRGGIWQLTIGNTVFSYVLRPDMADKPVNFISLYDSMRYCNWLHNDQPAAKSGTETGAYTMDPVAEAADRAIPREPGARYWVPGIDEWFKAAYFNPATGTYSTYPTGDFSTIAPVQAIATATGTCANPGTRVCNYNEAADWNARDGNVLSIGSCGSQSFFGCFDMGGNVSEWTDDPAPTSTHGRIPGGHFASSGPDFMSAEGVGSSSIRRGANLESTGLRVASISPRPVFAVSKVEVKPGTGPPPAGYDITITVPSQIGCRYAVESASRLFLWEPVAGVAVQDGTGGPITFTFHRSRTGDFFHVVESNAGE